MSVHLITYGSNQFINSKKRMMFMGIKSGWFNTVKMYGPEDLTEDFKTLTDQLCLPSDNKERSFEPVPM